ncbi:MAG: hypothetical protein HYT93_03415 [Parcubacteria group bacterium]|nr:hypothetical protein [Parcubacteria group bacterium]
MQTVKTVTVQQRGTYSIYYSHGDDSPDLFALDWAFTPTDGISKNDGKPAEHKWFSSVKEGQRWWPHNETDEKMHEVLLEHFGLAEWKEQYPLKEMKLMSPRMLARERLEKERKNPRLEKHKMKSDTAGFPILAKEYRD